MADEQHSNCSECAKMGRQIPVHEKGLCIQHYRAAEIERRRAESFWNRQRPQGQRR